MKRPSQSPSYRSWTAMKARCYNPKNNRYAEYGGRGIVVCERWKNSFAAFVNDMGEKPTSKHSIDRIDNDGNYEPSNCRWATRQEQSRNRRWAISVVFNGVAMTVPDVAKVTGWCEFNLYRRLRTGESMESIVSNPPVRTRFHDLTGKRFGRLTAVERAGSLGVFPLWKCLCDCGQETIGRADVLKRGGKKSCGCLARETARKVAKTLYLRRK